MKRHREAEAIVSGRRHQAELRPIIADMDDAPDWSEGLLPGVMDEIREIYGDPREL